MLEKVIKYSIGSDLAIYIFRCCLGFWIGYELYVHFIEHQLYWALLSIVLVISPEAKDSKRLAIERFKANFIGSGIGLLCFLIGAPNFFMIIVGIVLAIIICYVFKLMNVVRTAIVALIIVLIYERDNMSWMGAIERFSGVALGCLIGLAITVITSYGINFLRKKWNLPEDEGFKNIKNE
ncbi:FUSC family protein [Flavobacterium sp. NRK F10]|uniref:FUSC family protein n=1 Tax=Flavobacterium sp. NRK F10 TaxID=2954931 RepID=UPI002090B6A4|nr:FUSC family protein [Flavobacterium sp. NRK F10]MCO6174741.1 FUSC family protein [Flavobacterium sp. NRK F10]